MSHIKTFARIKPGEDLYGDHEIRKRKIFTLRVPEVFRDYGGSPSRNRASNITYDFTFDQIFDTSISQEDVYNIVAQEIVTGTKKLFFNI